MQAFYINMQTLYKALIRKESGNEFRYFKMADGEGDQRDMSEYYLEIPKLIVLFT